MRIAVVDDERLIRKDLIYYLKDIVPDAEIEEADSGFAAVELANSKTFDIFFLDINLGDMIGTVLALMLQKTAPDAAVIFVTAYGEYAPQAFELNAVDYIMKPFNKERVDKALKKALQQKRLNSLERLEQASAGMPGAVLGAGVVSGTGMSATMAGTPGTGAGALGVGMPGVGVGMPGVGAGMPGAAAGAGTSGVFMDAAVPNAASNSGMPSAPSGMPSAPGVGTSTGTNTGLGSDMAANGRIAIHHDRKVTLVEPDDIIFIESTQRNCCVCCAEGKKYITPTTLTELERRLAGRSFMRVHKSFIINLAHVSEIAMLYAKNYCVKMKGYEKTPLPVGRNQIKKLKNMFRI